jgi:cardiolipin synthase
MNIYDPRFAREQAAIFDEDISKSRLVRMEDFKNRPLRTKIMDRLAGALGSQL